MVKAKNYKEHLLKQLKKPEEAAAYLNAALNDDDPHVFLLALRDIAEAKVRLISLHRGVCPWYKWHQRVKEASMSENAVDYFHFEKSRPSFENLGRQNGFRYWFARDLMKMLGYTDYAIFKKGPINKAMTVCSTLDIDVSANFEQDTREIDGVKQPDYRLSKFACYLVAMNGDVKKKEVALAQAYFITVTEAFKRYINEAQQVERIAIRGEVSEREKSLAAVASNAGVEKYAFFQNKGYLGLYNMSINQLRERKGIPDGRSPLDFMGKEELAANLFRITQTEAKIRNEGIRGQKKLEDAAYSVGRHVRKTMEEISGTRPENLPIDTDINTVKSAIKSTQKEFLKLDQSKKQADEILLPFENS